ncbi:RagB/SusD family nutrient uptake outer membrane protein [Chitinophaga solisilvae]|uniref:RagB/SusD family nutrient uptake outer membrane protein n=1 Tax=Chitinophaga solisilvae TaxID=1233460 RepID=UPI00192132C0|nr:RagB/SusD family nutrient uptake outer membrane protein [Chitinophaga solisilvae]
MNNRISIYSFRCMALLASLSLFSCNKQLDLSPTDTMDEDKAYRNVADLNGGLLGAYSGLSFNAIYAVSLVTDECTLPGENSTGGGFASYRWQIDPSNTTITDAFGEYYIVIDRINRVLGALDKVSAKPAEVAAKAQYQGELLALRAYCHFALLQNFAEAYTAGKMGVPYMEKSGIGSPARHSFNDVVSKLEKDLQLAKTLIPADADDRGRITKAGVSAIQARVALYAKQWDDAVTFSTEAIDAVPLADRSAFPGIWTDTKSDEVIWKIKKVVSDDLIGQLYFNRRRALYVPSFELIGLFDKVNDVRYPAFILFDDTRGDGKSQYLVNKYSGAAGTPGLADIKMFRTGEMYLIRAEARAEKAQLTAAAKDLNDLRTARIKDYTPKTFADKTALMEGIVTERFKELAFEGHRMFDLRRWNLPVTRNPEDAVLASGAVLLTPGKKGYVFPIPDREMKANKNMNQNPGY